MPKPPLIAVDTNVLMDLADGNETALDCLATLLNAILAASDVAKLIIFSPAKIVRDFFTTPP
jgi:hypothetical protein